MSKRLTGRVLLLGWDAADWKIINPLLEAGQMPVLKRLVEHGVIGKIATLHPMLSPILWNSIATGKRADKHGILGFLEPTPDAKGVRPVSSTSRRVKAIWNILSQQGLRSGVVNWFASHPAEPINGIVFSNRLTEDGLGPDGDLIPLPASAVHPPELLSVAEDLRVHPGEISLKQLLAFFDPEHLPDPKDPRFAMFARHLAQCSSTHNAATWLAARSDWDLLAVYYDAIDRIGHEFIEYHPPAMAHVDAADAATYAKVVTGIYRFHDMMLGRLLDLVGPETTVLIVSDHGFYSDHLRPAVAEHTRDPQKKFGPEQNPVAWHRPHGIFLAAGKAIIHDELIHGAGLLDVAPTVLTLLGVPIPDDMDGRPLTRILADPAATIARTSSYEAPDPLDGVHRGVDPEEADPFAAREAVRQLAALGYVDLPVDGDAAVQVASVDRDRRQNLAQVLFDGGRIEEAVALLQGLLVEHDTTTLRCQLAQYLTSLGRLTEAESTLSPAQADHTASPVERMLIGHFRLAQGRVEEAQSILEPLLNEKFPLSYLHTTLGSVYGRRQMWSQAEAAFRTALDRDDDNADAHDGLGTVLAQTGRFEEAVFSFMKSAALLHARPQTHLNLGVALLNTGQIDWAIRAFEVAVELAPGFRLAHDHLARLYNTQKNDPIKANFHAALAAAAGPSTKNS